MKCDARTGLVAHRIEEEADGVSSRGDNDHYQQVSAPVIRSEPDTERCGKQRDQKEEPPIARYRVSDKRSIRGSRINVLCVYHHAVRLGFR